ncbi:MAG: hypothetical protein ACREQ7_12065 [Candidatus Binatia bacterium]
MASQAETGGFREVGYFFDQEDRLRHKAEADQLQLKLFAVQKSSQSPKQLPVPVRGPGSLEETTGR